MIISLANSASSTSNNQLKYNIISAVNNIACDVLVKFIPSISSCNDNFAQICLILDLFHFAILVISGSFNCRKNFRKTLATSWTQ
uniref:Uncharacterized protein n=1 Tax=Romanomermis culicivorax TaxID=13658 RepID=A0A915I406_ROMCU